ALHGQERLTGRARQQGGNRTMKPFLIAAAAALVLCAPAARAQDVQTDWMKYNPYVGEQNDISNPHRTADGITSWAADAVANALTFQPGQFREQIARVKAYFGRAGWQGYTDYLKESKIYDVARAGQYTVATAANGEPMITRKGARDGAYQWEVEVPVITS